MVTLVLIGCGGMGCRHIKGLKRLQDIGELPFQLAGVCDIFSANAERAADLAHDLLGTRPQVFSSFADMHKALGQIDAMIVTTAPDTHAEVGIEAFAAGVNVMVEKPIALTVAQGITLIDAATNANRKLAVAENYRRDPINRLAKAVLDSGVLGPIHLFVQSSSGSGEKVIITPWRHKKHFGGIVVDMGIHYADLMEYFIGPIGKVFGFNGIVDKTRRDDAGNLHEVDAEDLSVGVAQFESGAIGNWVIDLGGRGQRHFSRMAYGINGTLGIPPDRSGKPLELTLRKNGTDTRIGEDDLLAMVPNFALDEVTAKLFGGARLASYQMDYVDIDSGLLAIEQADFAASIVESRPPEVDGHFALRSLAIAYGFIEAELVGRALDVSALIENRDSPYQAELMVPVV